MRRDPRKASMIAQPHTWLLKVTHTHTLARAYTFLSQLVSNHVSHLPLYTPHAHARTQNVSTVMSSFLSSHHIYIYIYICVCVCV